MANSDPRDSQFDASLGLLFIPPKTPSGELRHEVLTTLRYARAIFDRGVSGDLIRARRILGVVCDYQFTEPGHPYFGTIRRIHEEKLPPAGDEAICWWHYDPNFREFAGLELITILEDHADKLSPQLIERIERFLLLACAGTMQRDLPLEYSNPALMEIFLTVYSGHRLGKSDILNYGLARANAIHTLFRRHDAFDEYNTPTYYGVDFDALDKWICYSPHPTLVTLGKDLATRLWRDIAFFYHAGLHNLCGPYDRSYGMDLRKYPSGLGAYIKQAVPDVPFPDEPKSPALAALIPPETLPHFQSFQGGATSRLVNRLITDHPIKRTATAWLSPNLMIGGQDSSYTKHPWDQYHPATIHWRLPDGDVGWIKLVHSWPADAVAGENSLAIRSFIYAGTAGYPFSYAFHIYAPGANADLVMANRWALPNLAVDVQFNIRAPKLERIDEHTLCLTYSARNYDSGYAPEIFLRTRWGSRKD